MCSWAREMPARPKCVAFSNCVHWSNKRSDLQPVLAMTLERAGPGSSCLCVSVCCPALPKGPATPGATPGTHPRHGRGCSDFSFNTGCQHLALRLLWAPGSVCSNVEIRDSSAKHWGIRQDGCGVTGASRGAPGRREQLHPCRDFSGMWAPAGGLVALCELVHAVVLWILLCKSAGLELG